MPRGVLCCCWAAGVRRRRLLPLVPRWSEGCGCLLVLRLGVVLCVLAALGGRVAVAAAAGPLVWPGVMTAPPLALLAVGTRLERGGGESLGSACGPLTTTLAGAVYLLEGVILLPFFSLSNEPFG